MVMLMEAADPWKQVASVFSGMSLISNKTIDQNHCMALRSILGAQEAGADHRAGYSRCHLSQHAERSQAFVDALCQ